MADLIDRQTLLLTLGQMVNNGKTDEMRKGVFAGLEYCRQLIEMQKPVEAEPVRHGRWIDWSMFGKLQYQCSECKAEMKFKTNFCPRCGERMDGDKIG